MKKILLLIVMVICTILVFIFANSSLKKIDTNYETIRPLEIRKSDILMELDSLEREYDLKLNGMTLSFLMFSDFDNEYFDEVTTLLDKYGYYGTLILSEENFPTKDGYLTIDEFNTLIKKGWNYCILYDNPDQFYQLERLFEVNGMRTDTVYFNKGKYSTDLDEQLYLSGYKSIVHHGEKGLNLYVDNLNNGIWHVGNMGIVGNAPKGKLLEAVEVTGSFSYTISFDKNKKEEYYDYETLTLVMNTFNTLVNKNALKVTDLERGLIYKEDIKENYEMNHNAYTQQKEKLTKELEEIEKQIEELERG